MQGNPTVGVRFDKNANPQFTFDNDRVVMKAAGKILLIQRPASQPWTFRDADVKDDTLNQFSSTPLGNTLEINDAFRDRTLKEYSYNVTVELDGTTFQSPDPVIVNDPGGR